MFERVQKPFLTVETGEAYQPIRLNYFIADKKQLLNQLKQVNCLEQKEANTWEWYWRDECQDLHFESLDTYQKDSENPLLLGSFILKDDNLHLQLPSFKRACIALPFFHRTINPKFARVHHADFINKVFGIDEQVPDVFNELFKENLLEKIVQQRVSDYEKVQALCEQAKSADEAFALIHEYAEKESNKRLPYAERYEFTANTTEQDPDVLFLGFYIFLRSRELVAIRRWFGRTNYNLADAADENIEAIFGDMDVDIIE